MAEGHNSVVDCERTCSVLCLRLRSLWFHLQINTQRGMSLDFRNLQTVCELYRYALMHLIDFENQTVNNLKLQLSFNLEACSDCRAVCLQVWCELVDDTLLFVSPPSRRILCLYLLTQHLLFD